MDSKAAGRKANLKQYRAVNGKWQFVPVVRVNGRPRPELVLIDGKPERSKGGTFYLEWRENGNLTLLSHAVDGVWRLPKYFGNFFHRKQTGERVESGQDVKWGITPRREESIFQRSFSMRLAWIGLGTAWGSGLNGPCPFQGMFASRRSMGSIAGPSGVPYDHCKQQWWPSLALISSIVLAFRRNSKTRAVGLANQQCQKSRYLHNLDFATEICQRNYIPPNICNKRTPLASARAVIVDWREPRR